MRRMSARARRTARRRTTPAAAVDALPCPLLFHSCGPQEEHGRSKAGDGGLDQVDPHDAGHPLSERVADDGVEVRVVLELAVFGAARAAETVDADASPTRRIRHLVLRLRSTYQSPSLGLARAKRPSRRVWCRSSLGQPSVSTWRAGRGASASPGPASSGTRRGPPSPGRSTGRRRVRSGTISR